MCFQPPTQNRHLIPLCVRRTEINVSDIVIRRAEFSQRIGVASVNPGKRELDRSLAGRRASGDDVIGGGAVDMEIQSFQAIEQATLSGRGRAVVPRGGKL